jgi:hypothetical protein
MTVSVIILLLKGSLVNKSQRVRQALPSSCPANGTRAKPAPRHGQYHNAYSIAGKLRVQARLYWAINAQNLSASRESAYG